MFLHFSPNLIIIISTPVKNENEKIKMGNSSGWYAGAVINGYRFKDLGKSKENQSMFKAGVFKTMSPKNDHNGALSGQFREIYLQELII